MATLSDIDIEWHPVIEIRDRHDRLLVTMIEVLSPSNKRYGPDREQYLILCQSFRSPRRGIFRTLRSN
ncbi:MAG: DUF4058 family protein [Pirellula sp.]|nr:DUF4058 family protein [Pirellula sp.]